MKAKELAQAVIPLLKSVKHQGKWGIFLYSNQYGESSSSVGKAWISALDHINSIKFKKGDLVVMQNCIEARHAEQKVWKCRTDIFASSSNEIVVFLENFSGYFSCYFLRRATKKEAQEYEKMEAESVGADII